MAFNIVLYKNSSEPNRIDKSNFLSGAKSISGVLKNESAVVNPTVVINFDNPSDYNYCFINKFNRYYYIRDVISIRNNIWEVYLASDPLMSFANEILGCDCIIRRQQNKGNNMYNDGTYKVSTENAIEIINFPSTVGDTLAYFLTHL